MLNITKVFFKDQVSFSTQHRDLVKRAYPYSRGKELQQIKKVLDRMVNNNEFMRQRMEDYLRGRAFGFWGKVA